MDLHEIKSIMRKHRIKSSYNSFEPAAKKKKLQQISSRNKLRRQWKSATIPTLNVYIEEFKKKIREGPYYICCVCNTMLYKKSVKNFLSTEYPDQKSILAFTLHLMVRNIFAILVTQKLNKVKFLVKL